LRGEGWGEGLFPQFGQQGLKYAVYVLDDLVIPNPDYPIIDRCQITVALLISGAVSVLATVDFDDQALFTADEVNVVGTDRLLAGEFKAAELPVANASPQCEFGGCQGTPQ